VVGNPKCLRIFPTTSGSERSARTTMGTVCAAVPRRGHGEHLGHASASTCITRRSKCAQGIRRRDRPDGGPLEPIAPVSLGSCTSADTEVSMSEACRDGGGGGNNLRALLRFASMP
jgi:hypothetical protein